MENRSKPIIVEQEFNADIESVWKAITELSQMTKWFFENIPDFKPQVGFKTSFNVSSTNRDFLHQWEIVEVIPNKKIVYNWSYPDFDGKAIVIFELFESKGKTILKLTNIGLDTFPESVPEFTVESCYGGWNYFIKERLKKYID